MKHTTLTCLLLLFSFILKAQQGWICLKEGADTVRLNSSVGALITDNGVLYIAGTFNNKYGSYHLSKWTGSSLIALDTVGKTLPNYSYISSFSHDKNGFFYASCSFDGNGKWYVAKWDGKDWAPLGGSDTALQSYYIISAVCSDAIGNVYVSTMHSTPNPLPFVAKWDGNKWAELSGSNIVINDGSPLCIDTANNIYAVGFTNSISQGLYCIVRWDGATWIKVGSGINALPSNDGISAICSDHTGNLYAACFLTKNVRRNFICKWDGIKWLQVGSDIPAINSDDYITVLHSDDSNNIYAAGKFLDSTYHRFIVKWDGVNWSELGTGTYALNPEGAINCIGHDQLGNIYAGGPFANKSKGITYIAKYMKLAGLRISQAPWTESKATLYPNPGTDKVIIDIPADIVGNLEAVIIDENGKIILHRALSPTAEGKIELNVTSLPRGHFYIRLRDVHGSIFSTLVLIK